MANPATDMVDAKAEPPRTILTEGQDSQGQGDRAEIDLVDARFSGLVVTHCVCSRAIVEFIMNLYFCYLINLTELTSERFACAGLSKGRDSIQRHLMCNLLN